MDPADGGARSSKGLRGSDARVNFLVTADEADTRAFLGPLVEEFLVFTDPDRRRSRRSASAQLPAFVFIRVDGTVSGRRRGMGRRRVAGRRRRDRAATAWSAPDIPLRRRPRTVPRLAGARPSGRRVRTPDAIADLPIDEILDELRGRAAGRHGRAVVVAPPGAGKTTVVPLALLDEPWLRRRADRRARATPPGDPRRGPADGRS